MKVNPWLVAGIVGAAGIAAFALYNMSQNKTPTGSVSKPIDNTGKDILTGISAVGGFLETLFGVFGGSDNTTGKNPDNPYADDSSWPKETT